MFSKNKASAAVDKMVRNFTLSSEPGTAREKPPMNDPKAVMRDSIIPEENGINESKNEGNTLTIKE